MLAAGVVNGVASGGTALAVENEAEPKGVLEPGILIVEVENGAGVGVVDLNMLRIVSDPKNYKLVIEKFYVHMLLKMENCLNDTAAILSFRFQNTI